MSKLICIVCSEYSRELDAVNIWNGNVSSVYLDTILGSLSSHLVLRYVLKFQTSNHPFTHTLRGEHCITPPHSNTHRHSLEARISWAPTFWSSTVWPENINDESITVMPENTTAKYFLAVTMLQEQRVSCRHTTCMEGTKYANEMQTVSIPLVTCFVQGTVVQWLTIVQKTMKSFLNIAPLVLVMILKSKPLFNITSWCYMYWRWSQNKRWRPFCTD